MYLYVVKITHNTELLVPGAVRKQAEQAMGASQEAASSTASALVLRCLTSCPDFL